MNTLTSAAPRFDLTFHEAECWRFVEDQNTSSTMKLVDSAEEQRILEELLDMSKPPVPAPCRHLHYLYFTPFRYPAREATRFRRRGEPRGVYYAAETLETAAAEVAFYRVLFFLESPDTAPPKSPFELTAFSAVVSSAACLDVTQQFDAPTRAALSDPVAYAPCHRLVDELRDAGGQIIRFPSVRHHGGTNLAVLSCAAFREPAPRTREGWWFSIRPDRIFASKRFGGGSFDFPFEGFANDPRIAAILKG